MKKARYNRNKYLSFFDASSEVADDSLFTATVKDASGSTETTLTFTETAAVPDLLISSVWVPQKAEQYQVTYLYNGTAIFTEYVEVGLYPITDFPLASAGDLVIDSDLAGGISETVTIKVFGSDGVEDVDQSASYDAALASYKSTHTFATADDYAVVWIKEIAGTPTPFYAQSYYVIKPVDKEVCLFTAFSTDGNNNTPHTSATVTLCDSTGAQFGKFVTDVAGAGRAELYPGTYTASIIKTGSVYTTNNWTITVVDTDTETGNNVFPLSSTVFIPTVSDPASPASLCTMTATLYRMDGSPLANADINVALVHRNQLFSGTGVVDTKKTYTTDHHGYVEFDLVQGLEVEVVIVPLSIRRIITVPASAGPQNILTLLSSADDLFDVVNVTFPTAPVRTL